jgi:hypothetical protein
MQNTCFTETFLGLEKTTNSRQAMLSLLFLALEPAGFLEDVWTSQLIVPHPARCFTTAFPAAWTLLTHDYLSANFDSSSVSAICLECLVRPQEFHLLVQSVDALPLISQFLV